MVEDGVFGVEGVKAPWRGEGVTWEGGFNLQMGEVRGVVSVSCSSSVRDFRMPPPTNPHTHAHTCLALSPFGPSFILIYEPPHGHSAVPSLHRSLKVVKKLSSR